MLFLGDRKGKEGGERGGVWLRLCRTDEGSVSVSPLPSAAGGAGPSSPNCPSVVEPQQGHAVRATQDRFTALAPRPRSWGFWGSSRPNRAAAASAPSSQSPSAGGLFRFWKQRRQENSSAPQRIRA